LPAERAVGNLIRRMDGVLQVPVQLAHSLATRPYAFAPFAVFLLIASWHLGLRRTLSMALVGYLIAWFSEFSSIHIGFPYGLYHYRSEALRGDLCIFGVPFFDSLSYVFLAYFAWSSALFLLSPLVYRGGLDVQIAETRARRRSFGVLLVGAWLMTWLDVVVDPVACRGDRWFLGQIHTYAAPGAYFGVPFTNYAGWFLVGNLIVFAYQRIDEHFDGEPTRLDRFEQRVPGQALHGPVMYFAIVAFALAISWSIGELGLFWSSVFVQLPVLVWMLVRVFDERQHALAEEIAETKRDFPLRPL
jgi:putative membrane protein